MLPCGLHRMLGFHSTWTHYTMQSNNHLVDIPFPKKVRDEIVATGRVQPHHILPEMGWVSFYLREDGDVDKAVELLCESFKFR